MLKPVIEKNTDILSSNKIFISLISLILRSLILKGLTISFYSTTFFQIISIQINIFWWQFQDQVPMFIQFKMVSYTSILLVCLILCLSHTQQAGKLVMVQQIFRHGARYPDKILNIGDQFIAEQKLQGQLTTQGKSMHYLLGKKLYEQYWDKLFKGTPFEYRYNQSKFYIRSTNLDRTLESAQAHLLGVLENIPPLNISDATVKYSLPPIDSISRTAGPVYEQKGKYIHPTAIHSTEKTMTPFEDGDFLSRYYYKNCPNQKTWGKSNFEDPIAQKILNDTRYIQALNDFSAAVGKPMSFTNFTSYYDNLLCLQYLGEKVPAYFVEPSPSREALESLFSVAMYITYSLNEDQRRVQGSQLIQETLKNMNKVKVSQYNSPQWVMYSSHDLTINAVLSFFNMKNLQCMYECFTKNITNSEKCLTSFPIYASDLIFQLYKYSNGAYNFKVTYNGQYRRIPFCNYEYQCPLEKLQSYYDEWKVNDVRAACGQSYYYSTEMLQALFVFVIIALIWWIYLRLNYKKMLNKIEVQQNKHSHQA